MSVRREGIRVPRTESEAEAIGVAYELLTSGARRVQGRFTRPDDDWAPIFLTLTKKQGTILTPDRLAREDKRPTVEAVARWARRVGAVCVGHLHSSWFVLGEGLPAERMEAIRLRMEANRGSTEGIPERTEGLLLALHTAGGSAVHWGEIERRESAPPTLAPFRLLADTAENGEGFEGAMVDPLREAVWRRG
jgi:hypothetical protein